MRIARGCAALGVLAALLIGPPWLLLVVGQVPAVGSWGETITLLLRPGDGRLVLAVVTAVAWLAWLLFAVSTVVEAVNAVIRRRAAAAPRGPRAPIRLPGLGLPQAVAATLLLAVVAMITPAPVPAGADPPDAPVPPSEPSAGQQHVPPVTPADRDTERVADSAGGQPAQAGPRVAPQHVHVVVAGDDLWSLAERYYDDGLEWRRIAAANPDRLTGGPDELVIGWRLVIPGVAAEGSTVVVRTGDTLARLAADAYGDPAQWPRIHRANAELITDPHHIEVGWRLRIPSASPTTDRDRGEPAETQPTEPDDPRPPPAEPTPPVPTPPVPTQPAEPSTEPPAPSEPTATPVSATLAPLAVPVGLAAVGGLLAAGLITGVASRRELQLRSRPTGRRIVHPEPAAQAVEADLGRRSEPATLLGLDRALRAIDAHCRSQQLPAPGIVRVAVAAAGVEFDVDRTLPPPPGFVGQGRQWRLSAAAAAELPEEVDDRPRTTPALVCVGVDAAERALLVDLERAGLVSVEAPTGELAEAAMAALAMELSYSYWSDQLRVTLVGGEPGLVAAVAQDHLRVEHDVEAVLDRLTVRAGRQRAEADGRTPATHRLDPDCADAWASEVVLFDVPLDPAQEERLAAVLSAEPSVALAAVLGRPSGVSSRATRLVISDEGRASLSCAGHDNWQFRPQVVDASVRQALGALVSAAASPETTPAPWWDAAPTPVRRSEESVVDPANVNSTPPDATDGPEYPTLLLLGPVELVGARGTPPSRAPRQCLEYCAWLLERPGGTAPMMANGLAVAEGTRRSNMSRLRTWLGDDSDGTPFLPDAYSGRITLHECVSSDWERLQLLITGGVNRAATGSLVAALELVRGAPLADAAPGQWHWAEELRTDMASVIRDIGVEVTERALSDDDLGLARWAANRALTGCPADELLMCARIRTEHRAGRPAEVERLVRTVTAQARTLQVDLSDETIDLLQQVMEGRPRRG